MGILYSKQTNLLSQCTSFETHPSDTTACLGENVKVSMKNWKNGEDTDLWCVIYKTGQAEKHKCDFVLDASRENNRVKSIGFQLRDKSAINEILLDLYITRVGRDRLRGGISSCFFSSDGSTSNQMSFKRKNQDISIETTIVSYSCSHRRGLVVLEMKKLLYSRNAYMVNVAHYFVTEEVGFSVATKVRRNKDHGFVVEVEGPFVHPSADLRKVIEQICQTGIWSPGASSHCNNGASTSTGSSLSDKKISQILKRLPSSGNVRDQVYTGLINDTGYTNGILNNSIILIDCKI